MKNIFLILSSVLLNCTAQFLIRKGMLQINDFTGNGKFLASIPAMLCNVLLWCAIVCYGLSFLLWMAVLSKFEVSYAYPFLSIGYVISAVVGYFAFGEHLSVTRILGITIICIGVILISRS